MKFLPTMAAIILIATAGTTAASDSGVVKNGLAEYGASLAPIGFLRYCAEQPTACNTPASADGAALVLTPERWRLLYQINSYVNNKLMPVSDMEQHGEIERWSLPRDRGDCEDYVLLKQDYLESLGIPAAALRITVVLDENNEGHAVLTVAAQNGDFVLDNRRNDILSPVESKYTFLKRQSGTDPKRWVSLTKQRTKASGLVAASQTLE